MHKATWIFLIALQIQANATSPHHADQADLSAMPNSDNNAVNNDSGELTQECREFIAHLPKDMIRGFVDVPEDWSNPSGRKIQVFYYGRIHPGKQPVAFFNGGPGADAHDLAFDGERQATGFGKLPLIYIDQRGTGCSSPYPSDGTPASVKRANLYASRSIVKDAEAIRTKLLGSEGKWKIFGQSYGSLIVHRYVAVAPQYLSSAFAHGYALSEDPVNWMKERIIAQHKSVAKFFKAYPEARSNLKKLRSRIRSDQCVQTKWDKICGENIVDALILYTSFPSHWASFNERLKKVLADGSVVSDDHLRKIAKKGGLGGDPELSVVAVVDITNGLLDKEICHLAEQRLPSADNPSNQILDQCRFFKSTESHQRDQLIRENFVRDPLRMEDVTRGLKSNPQLKLHLYSGSLDGMSSTEVARQEARALKGFDSHYKNFRKSGHDGFMTEKKIISDIQRSGD